MIERDTGTVLYEKNSHEKLATCINDKNYDNDVDYGSIDKGQIKWEDKVRTSEYAASMGGSQIFLEPGEEMTVEGNAQRHCDRIGK